MRKLRFSIICVCLFLIPVLGFAAVKINPVKIYEAGVKAYESENYKKASRLFEDAIKAGLSGVKLKEAYRKLYFSAFISDDPKKIGYYEAKCESLIHGFRPITNAALTDLKETALYLAKASKSPRVIAMSLSELAVALAKTGKFDQAMNIANSIQKEDDDYKLSALQATDEAHKNSALAGIAQELAKTGRFDQAMDTIAMISHQGFFLHRRALRGIACELAKAGKLNQAKNVVKFSNFRLGNCIELGKINRKINGLSHFFT